MVTIIEGEKDGASGDKSVGPDEGIIDEDGIRSVDGSVEGKIVGVVDGNPVRRILRSCEGKNVCAMEGDDDS